MIEQRLLNVLKAAQAEYAIEALKKPNRKDVYEYGYHVGMMHGLEKAINKLTEMVDEEKNGR